MFAARPFDSPPEADSAQGDKKERAVEMIRRRRRGWDRFCSADQEPRPDSVPFAVRPPSTSFVLFPLDVVVCWRHDCLRANDRLGKGHAMRNHTALFVFLLVLLVLVSAHWYLTRNIRINPVNVRQLAQLRSIETGLELFSHEVGGYPRSDVNDPAGVPYCGAMKLAEAVLGRDLCGFHSRSGFRADGLDPNGETTLYPNEPDKENLEARKGPYLQRENANAYRLADVYGKGNTGPFDEGLLVFCDTYPQKRPSGKKTGMPILYYRARPKGTAHDVNDPDNPANIYDYRDNQVLVGLGVPGEPNAVHPLSDPRRFYLNTMSDKSPGPSRPCQPDSFILISAGYDGLYGTSDDVCNFTWKYRE